MRSTNVVLLLLVLPAIVLADIRTHPKYKEWVLALSDGPDNKRLETLQALNTLKSDTSPLFPVMRVALKETTSPIVATELAKHANQLRVETKELLPDLLRTVRRGILAPMFVILLAAKYDDPALVELVRGQLVAEVAMLRAELDVPSETLIAFVNEYPQRAIPALAACFDETDEDRRQLLFELLHTEAASNETSGTFTKRPHNRTKIWQEPTFVATLEKGVRPFVYSPDPKTRMKAVELLWYVKPALADEFFAQYFTDFLDGAGHCEIRLCYEAFVRAFSKLTERLLASHRVADGAHDLIHELCSKYVLDEARASVLPVVRRHLRHTNPDIRRTLLRVLMHTRPYSGDAIREFTRGLDDPDRGVRLAACEGLLQRPEDLTPAVVRALREAINTAPVRQREVALRLLALAGPAGRVLMPDLLRLAKQPSARVRGAVGFALFKIDPKMRATYLPLFADTLTTGAWAQQKPVLLALPDIGPPAKHLVPALQKLLQENLHDYERANPIANAIIWISPEHAKATRELLYSKRTDP